MFLVNVRLACRRDVDRPNVDAFAEWMGGMADESALQGDRIRRDSEMPVQFGFDCRYDWDCPSSPFSCAFVRARPETDQDEITQ